MLLNQELRDSCLILRPTGRIDSMSASQLARVVSEQIEAGIKHIVLDCSDMEFINSSGLRVVLLAGKRLKAVGGGLALACLRDMVREIFEMIGFIALFPTAVDLDDALQQMERTA